MQNFATYVERYLTYRKIANISPAYTKKLKKIFLTYNLKQPSIFFLQKCRLILETGLCQRPAYFRDFTVFIYFLQYCDSAPGELPICNSSNQKAAYTSFQYFDAKNGVKSMQKDQIHCICPDGYNYLDTRYKFLKEGPYDVAIINYYCLPVSYLIT